MKVGLIIPCYNEQFRLDAEAFLKYQKQEIKFLFVDDGSEDKTAEILNEKLGSNSGLDSKILILPQNMGKAEAVRQAFLFGQRESYWNDCDWVGFWDCDLATPLYEVRNMVRYLELYGPEVQAIWGSRIYRLGSRIVRNPFRHYLGRCFATLIDRMLEVESYDSQCGAKLFRKSAAETAFGEPFISKWIFDVEILLRLRQKNIVEYPLKEWVDAPGSKVKVFKELPRVFREVLLIRKKYLGREFL